MKSPKESPPQPGQTSPTDSANKNRRPFTTGTARAKVKAGAIAVLACTVFANCSYRFSNLYQHSPKGIQTIAFDSIYDSSGKVRPHELLWEQLQRAFAMNGKLRVTAIENADAFLQAHLVSASSSQSKPITSKRPEVDQEYDPNSPLLPSSYRRLGKSSIQADKQEQQMDVKIAVWHLRTRKLLFKKTYRISSGSHRLLDNTTTTENQFLRAEEGFENNFSLMSRRLATQVVNDLLRSR